MSAFVQARPKYPTDCFPPPAQRPDPRCAVRTGTSQDIHCDVYGTATHPWDPAHPRWKKTPYPISRRPLETMTEAEIAAELRNALKIDEQIHAEERRGLGSAPIDTVYPTSWGRNVHGALRRFEQRMAGGWNDTPGGPIAARVHGGLGDLGAAQGEGDSYWPGFLLGVLVGGAIGWAIGSRPKPESYRIGRR